MEGCELSRDCPMEFLSDAQEVSSNIWRFVDFHLMTFNKRSRFDIKFRP